MGCTKETDAYDMAACCVADLVLGQRNQVRTGDPVNVVTGSLSFITTDLVWPQSRLPIVFSRAYDSGAHNRGYVGGLGPGWTHSWELRLEFDSGQITYTDDRHVRIPFSPAAPPPPGAKGMRLDETSEGWTVRQIDGLSADFNRDGRLLRLRRPGPRRDSVVTFFGVDGHIHKAVGVTGALELSWKENRIVSLKVQDGRKWKYSYDNKGRLIAVERPSGVRECYSYCYADLMETAEGEGAARPVHRAVEGIHQVFAPAPPGEKAPALVTNSYTSAGRVARQVDAIGGITRFDYNLYTRMTGVTDPEGWTTVYVADPEGRTVRVRSPEGRVSEHVYDDQGNLLANIEDGQRTEFVTFNNPDWHLVADDLAMRPAGHRADHLRFKSEDLAEPYDENGGAPLLRDALGRVTRFSDRNLFGTPGRIDWPDGEHTLNTYDDRSGILRRQERWRETELLLWKDIELDEVGNTIRVTEGPEPIRNEVRLYDDTGTFVTERHTYANRPDFAVRERFFRDTGGRIVRHETEIPVEPGGPAQVSVEETGYDADGNISWQISSGQGRAFVWDMAGRLLGVRMLDPSTRQPGIWLERREYDDAGRCVLLTDAAGGETRYYYDRCGRLLRIELPDCSVRTLAFDRDGRIIAESGPEGERCTTYEGLATIIKDDLGRTWTAERDAVGRIMRALSNGCGTTWSYSKNQVCIMYADQTWGRQGPDWTERGPHPSQRVEWHRDRLGRPLELRVGTGPAPVVYQHWSWGDDQGEIIETDGLNRSTRIKIDAASRPLIRREGTATLTLTRDDSGRIVHWRSDDESVDIRFGYSADKLVSVDAPGWSERWSLDEAGRAIVHEQTLDGESVHVGFNWDQSGRLTVVKWPGASMSIVHSENGRRSIQLPGRCATVEKSAHRSEIRWDNGSVLGTTETASGMERWVQERDGRRWLWSMEWDSRGRPGKQECETPSGTSVHQFHYDALNRLTTVLDGHGRERLGIAWDERGNPREIRREERFVSRFEVDDADQITAMIEANGRRTGVEHDSAGRISAFGELQLAYDAAGRPTRVGSYTNVRCASDGSLAGWTRAGKKERVVWALGRPVRLPGGIDVFWLDDEVLACRMGGHTYPVWTDPWGSLVGVEGHLEVAAYGPFGEAYGRMSLPLAYCGRLRVGQLLDCRARLYLPMIGRFVQPDPEGVADDTNRYLYAHGNPLVWTDPSGRSAERSGVGCLAHLPSVELLPLVSIEAFRVAGLEVVRTDIVGPAVFEKRGRYEHRDKNYNLVGITLVKEPGFGENRPHFVHYNRNYNKLGESFIKEPDRLLGPDRHYIQTFDTKWQHIGNTYVERLNWLQKDTEPTHLKSYDASFHMTGSARLINPDRIWLNESHPHLEHYDA